MKRSEILVTYNEKIRNKENVQESINVTKKLLLPFILSLKTENNKLNILSLLGLKRFLSCDYFVFNKDPNSPTSEWVNSLLETILKKNKEIFHLQIIDILYQLIINEKVGLHGNQIVKSIKEMFNFFNNNNTEEIVEAVKFNAIQIIDCLIQRNEKKVKKTDYLSTLFDFSLGENNQKVTSKEMSKSILKNVFSNILKHKFKTQNQNSIQEIQSKINEHLIENEKTNNKSGSNNNNNKNDHDHDHDNKKVKEKNISLVEKDICLVFSQLHAWSMRDISQISMNNTRYKREVRFKVMALYLIKLMIEKAGTKLRSSENFISIIRNKLCLSILQNGLSTNTKIFSISFIIFSLLFFNFRHNLKNEIGIFLNKVFLKFLASKNTQFKQKIIVLNIFHRLCSEPQFVVDIFINYDCDPEATEANIFERLINLLNDICQEKYNENLQNWISKDEYIKIKNIATRVLVRITKSLMIWCGELDESELNVGENIEKIISEDEESKMKNNNESLETISILIDEEIMNKNNTKIKQNNKDNNDNSNEDNNNNNNNNSNNNNNNNNKTTTNQNLNNKIENINENKLKISNHHLKTLNTIQKKFIDKIIIKSPQDISEQKKKKTNIENGIKLFNESPKKGIAYFIELGKIENTIVSVTNFLQNTQGLDLEMIGDYLGSEKEFNIKVLHYWVDQLDFTNLDFYSALRLFLSGFRLPGEAQKIDRMMEKFADRYCNNNPNLFKSADTAYVLAYSVIMLHTDAHSKQIKNKMSKEEFISNNRGIDSGQNLDPHFLSQIYEDVVTIEMKLRSDQEKLMQRVGEFLTPKQKQDMYKVESENIIMDSQEELKRIIKNNSKINEVNNNNYFYTATHVSHVRPMFEMGWEYFLASFSQILIETDDSNLPIIKKCLFGIRYSIRITGIFYMQLEKDAFVTSLSKFTLLSNTGEMKQKNIESIKILLNIALYDGDYLQNSWIHVLACISQLQLLKFIGENKNLLQQKEILKNKNLVLDKTLESSQKISKLLTSKFSMNEELSILNNNVDNHDNNNNSAKLKKKKKNLKNIIKKKKKSNSYNELYLSQTNSQNISKKIDSILIEKIFTNTIKLNDNSIVHFVAQLCKISEKELEFKPKPRFFSLQKLIEITCYNMNRIRIVWSRMWIIISEHLNKYTQSDDKDIAFYTINGLRQIATTYFIKIEKELKNYSFQSSILKPFFIILKFQKNPLIRIYSIQSLNAIIINSYKNFNSGWDTIFSLLKLITKDKDESVLETGMNLIEKIFKKKLYLENNNNNFIKFINLIRYFATIENLPNSLLFKPISLLIGIIQHINIKYQNILQAINDDNRIVDKETNQNENEKKNEIAILKGKNDLNREQLILKFYFPIFNSLIKIFHASNNNQLQEILINEFFLLIKGNIKLFNQKIQRQLLNEIFFNLIKKFILMKKFTSKKKFNKMFFNKIMNQMLEIYILMFNKIKNTFNFFLEMINEIILLNDSILSYTCLNILLKFLKKLYLNFDDQMIKVLTNYICKLIIHLIPNTLLLNPLKVKNDDLKKDGQDSNGDKKDDDKLLFEFKDYNKFKMQLSNKIINNIFNKTDFKIDQKIKTYKKLDQTQNIFFNSQKIKFKIKSNIALFNIVNFLIDNFFDKISFIQLKQLLNSLKISFTFAQNFNQNLNLRIELFTKKFYKNKNIELLNLLNQEINSLNSFLKILFLSLKNNQNEKDINNETNNIIQNEIYNFARENILKIIPTILENQYNRIISLNNNNQKQQYLINKRFQKVEIFEKITKYKKNEISKYNPIISLIIQETNNSQDYYFKSDLSILYKKIILLTISENDTIRKDIADFLIRFSKLFDFL
ncbi:hypothetical protein M0813_00979 [Anaeramoeba flamelloides]|uniref:SEC7 domain-containing protein n=1 Tax=Anaeramoeba flamelloides TaxID=1746091 RepID=A0ABQ8X0K9_9EUKA|nr:hypothetical protein M0813_00979 [Anaeramoeba flamelloides]